MGLKLFTKPVSIVLAVFIIIVLSISMWHFFTTSNKIIKPERFQDFRFLNSRFPIEKSDKLISRNDSHYQEKINLVKLNKFAKAQLGSRVKGGKEASIGEFPFMAVLRYNVSNESGPKKTENGCGGSLITGK
jgi:hypothetical protein